MRVLRVFGFFFLLGSSLVFGQAVDPHVTSDKAQALYQRSAYAHGYIHGYEDGFHNADMDIHMGRGERPLSTMKGYRDSCSGYRDGFGDKQYFRLGYKQGFREGYSDSSQGDQFRAVEETRKAAYGIGSASASSMSEKDFDKAFARGYDVGYDRGSTAPMQSAGFDYAANACQSQVGAGEVARQSEYCDAFIRGFSLGFGDGQAGPAKRRTQTARK